MQSLPFIDSMLSKALCNLVFSFSVRFPGRGVKDCVSLHTQEVVLLHIGSKVRGPVDPGLQFFNL